MSTYSKYLFELLAIFIAISLAYLVDEWRESRQNREETIKAVKMIRFDLRIDTSRYHNRLGRLKQAAEFLKPALDGELPEGDVLAFRKVLFGLRVNVDYSPQRQGITYLRNNIRYPSMKNDTLIAEFGSYYQLSSEDGNYHVMNDYHFEMSSDNYEDIYSFNPHFLNEDTAIAYQAIRENMNSFLQEPYWLGRINLTYREVSRTMPRVFEKSLKHAEFMLKKMEMELDPEVSSYPAKEGREE